MVLNSFLIIDSATAKSVAYNNEVKVRAITIDGDIYDPGATITGGSISSSSSDILKRIFTLNELECEFEVLEQNEINCEEQFLISEKISSKYQTLSKSLSQKEYEYESQKMIISNSPAGRVFQLLEQHEQELTDLGHKMNESNKLVVEFSKKITILEKQMKEFFNDKEGNLVKLKENISNSKKKLIPLEKQLKKEAENVQRAYSKMKSVSSEVDDVEQQILSCEANIKQIKEENVSEELASLKSKYEVCLEKLKNENQSILNNSKALKNLETERHKCQEKINDLTLRQKKLKHEIERFGKEKESSKKAFEKLIQENDWIDSLKDLFGKPNTAFDFRNENPNECESRLQKLKEEHEVLRKRINVKVMNMIDRVITKENSLKQMLNTVKKDKQKIEDTIEQLDHYKKEALQKTWVKVSR